MSKYCPICLHDMTRPNIFSKRRCTNYLCSPSLTNDEYEKKESEYVDSVIRAIQADIVYYIDKTNPYLERLNIYEHAKGNVAEAKKMYFIPEEYELPEFEL